MYLCGVKTDRIMEFRIKEICKSKGILMKDLAAKMGITDIGLRQSLRGNPTIGTLEKIATILDVEVADLFRPSYDFIAFVRDRGETFTFTDRKEFKVYADNLLE